jgi:hypothetical protein
MQTVKTIYYQRPLVQIVSGFTTMLFIIHWLIFQNTRHLYALKLNFHLLEPWDAIFLDDPKNA